MKKINAIVDVFVSHSMDDVGLARSVVSLCREHSMEAATVEDLAGPGVNLAEVIWDVLAGCRALVVIIPSEGSPDSMTMIETGAAIARNKPIYAIAPEGADRTPFNISGVRHYSDAQVSEVVRSIESSVQRFTEEDRAHIAEAYLYVNASVDQLLLNPRLQDRLVKKYARITGVQVDGDRLIAELLRMRKQKKLPRRRASKRPAS